MKKEENIKIFEDKKVRTLWISEEEKWYLSIVDVISVLTDSPNPQVYWRVLKKRLKDEGNETVTICNALKMLAADGKRRLTDVARVARKELEAKTGKKGVTSLNAKNLSVAKLQEKKDK